MSDGTLSQDEIDALLQGASEDINSGGLDTGFGGSITDEEINLLHKIITEIIDSQTSTLSGLFQKDVMLSNPRIEIVNEEKLSNIISLPALEVSFPFIEGVVGDNIYFFREEDALNLGSMMMAQEVSELTEMIISAVAEAVSQMVGSALTTISNKYKKQITTGSPQQIVVKNFVDAVLPPDENFVLITYDLKVGDILTTNIFHVLSIGLAKGMAMLISGTGMPQSAAKPDIGFQTAPVQPQPKAVGKTYQPAAFSKLEDVLTEDEKKNISLLLDVEMEVTVELGRTKKTIKDILSMGEGTIISLDRLAGESIDILVNGKKIAKGEVIVIDENFGVRITEILSKTERLNSLQ